MQTGSFSKDLQFNDDKAAIKMILQTEHTKEIRVAMKAGQALKEHQTAHPIVVHLLSGQVDFEVQGETHVLHAGDILSLGASIKHEVRANEESVVRLSLAKLDTVDRVEGVANK